LRTDPGVHDGFTGCSPAPEQVARLTMRPFPGTMADVIARSFASSFARIIIIS